MEQCPCPVGPPVALDPGSTLRPSDRAAVTLTFEIEDPNAPPGFGRGLSCHAVMLSEVEGKSAREMIDYAKAKLGAAWSKEEADLTKDRWDKALGQEFFLTYSVQQPQEPNGDQNRTSMMGFELDQNGT